MGRSICVTASVVCSLALWATGVPGCVYGVSESVLEKAEQFYGSLAKHYAPVIHQGAASEQDYITAFDFDGDWIGNNNWENQPIGDLSAYVYYSVIESKTHWFLFYSLFHPRDYTSEWLVDGRCKSGCHENDLESIQLVVEKDGTPFGRLKALETLAHDSIYLYTFDRSVRSGFLTVTGPGVLEDGHPVVYVEAFGHGIYGNKGASSSIHYLPRLFGGGTVTYRVGEQADVPENLKDGNVSYMLVPIYTTLWARRDSIGDGQTFNKPFEYWGHVLPASIDGDTFGKDKANTPWGYNQATGAVLNRGDWFLDPARAVAFHASFEGKFSLEYLYNPFLTDLQ